MPAKQKSTDNRIDVEVVYDSITNKTALDAAYTLLAKYLLENERKEHQVAQEA